jgi:hypothetical protein
MIEVNGIIYTDVDLNDRLLGIRNVRPKPTLVGFLETCALGRAILKIVEIFCCVEFHHYARADYRWEDDYLFLQALRVQEANLRVNQNLWNAYSRTRDHYNNYTPLRDRRITAYVPPANNGGNVRPRVIPGSGVVNRAPANNSRNAWNNEADLAALQNASQNARASVGSRSRAQEEPLSLYVPPPMGQGQTRASVGVRHAEEPLNLAHANAERLARAPIGRPVRPPGGERPASQIPAEPNPNDRASVGFRKKT